MSIALVILACVFTTVFMGGCAFVLLLFFSHVESMQKGFFDRLDKKEAAAKAEQAAQEEMYRDFMELQAQREAVIAQADAEWIKHPDSASPTDPDLDWENEN